MQHLALVIITPGLEIAKRTALMPSIWIIYLAVCVDSQLWAVWACTPENNVISHTNTDAQFGNSCNLIQ